MNLLVVVVYFEKLVCLVFWVEKVMPFRDECMSRDDHGHMLFQCGGGENCALRTLGCSICVIKIDSPGEHVDRWWGQGWWRGSFALLPMARGVVRNFCFRAPGSR